MVIPLADLERFSDWLERETAVLPHGSSCCCTPAMAIWNPAARLLDLLRSSSCSAIQREKQEGSKEERYFECKTAHKNEAVEKIRYTFACVRLTFVCLVVKK